MVVLSSDDIREWDAYTIEHEPVASIDLMERAALACVNWIQKQSFRDNSFIIFCGQGNNGGDGLAIARLLLNLGKPVGVYILQSEGNGSEDFRQNLSSLRELPFTAIQYISNSEQFPRFDKSTIVIDALFGTGLSRPLNGLAAELVAFINGSGSLRISIDLPSGLFADRSSVGLPAVKAHHTLSFECYKKALLVAENESVIGQVHILSIGLDPGFLENKKTLSRMIEADVAKSIYRPRSRFGHKGSYGHTLLVTGSYGKMGAAVLATKACLRSGAGLVTVLSAACGNTIIQTAVPEAMFIEAGADKIVEHSGGSEIEKYTAVAAGPGLGTAEPTRKLLAEIFAAIKRPMVIDADAINCIAMESSLLSSLPAGTIITPHPKEFDRLFPGYGNDFERIEKATSKAKELGIIIILKGHHTFIAAPVGSTFFNTTGNAGMARGGSGDVLTGVLTALLCQGYEPLQAAVLGVFIHGFAGDLAADLLGEEAMLPSDLVRLLGKAFQLIRKN